MLPDNGGRRKQREGGNKELYLYVCCKFRFDLLKNNMIKLTWWNGIIKDINVTDVWNRCVICLIFRMGHVRGYLSS